MSNILHSSVSNEWYTPSRYPAAASLLMNGIELDPASCARANTYIQAERYYSAEQDGLAQSWRARSLWLNPPYGFTRGKSNQALWSAKLVTEYERGNVEQAILLVNATPGRSWFLDLWRYALVFTNPRIAFVSPEGEICKSPTHDNAFIYLGKHIADFYRIFAQFGTPAQSVRLEEYVA